MDELYRQLMADREFPAHEHGFDEMQALIHERNAQHAARGAFLSQVWRPLLVLPAALLLWWASTTDPGTLGSLAHTPPSSTAEERSAQGISPQHSPGRPELAVGNVALSTAIPIAHAHTAVGSTSTLEQGSVTAVQGSTMPRDSKSDYVEALHSEAVHQVTTTADPTAKDQPEFVSAAAAWREPGPAWLSTIPSRLQSELSATPVQPILVGETFCQRIPGELRLVGTMMHARATAVANGNSRAYGLEYALRKKRFSASLGMHYGTYALDVKGPAATDAVHLEYLQLPLLGGYEVHFGRVGVQVQAGISCDLLFNATGRYGPSAEQANTLDDEPFRTVGMQAVLRPQVIYRASEDLGLFAGPTYMQQLTSVALSGPLAGASTSSMGVSFGLIHKLHRSTF